MEKYQKFIEENKDKNFGLTTPEMYAHFSFLFNTYYEWDNVFRIIEPRYKFYGSKVAYRNFINSFSDIECPNPKVQDLFKDPHIRELLLNILDNARWFIIFFNSIKRSFRSDSDLEEKVENILKFIITRSKVISYALKTKNDITIFPEIEDPENIVYKFTEITPLHRSNMADYIGVMSYYYPIFGKYLLLSYHVDTDTFNIYDSTLIGFKEYFRKFSDISNLNFRFVGWDASFHILTDLLKTNNRVGATDLEKNSFKAKTMEELFSGKYPTIFSKDIQDPFKLVKLYKLCNHGSV